jgi:FkbM family methyltransferase
VLSFASNREEVLALLSEIDGKYDMLIPDMPVAGEEYFDSNFCNTRYQEILSAYSSLQDEESKNTFAAVVNYKLSGKLSDLLSVYATKDELYSLINSRKNIQSYVDGGAYNGDTLKEALYYFPDLKEATLIEPDKRSFKKLSAFADSVFEKKLNLYNAALWSSEGSAAFISSGNRNSSINSTASYENKTTEIEKATVDKLVKGTQDFIKYDVEGAELEALLGSDLTIKKDKPVLLVSAYHRSRDVFSLVNYLRESYPFYKIYMRRLRCVPAWELDIIAIPDK